MPDSLLNELYQVAAVTRRVLEHAPEDKMEWRPHPKSMSLGQPALRAASIPGNLSRLAQADEFDASQANFTPPSPSSIEETLTTHDGSLSVAQDYLGGVDEQIAQESWRLTFKGKEVFTAPRGGMIRSLMLNH
jgi:hypothetical protein